MPERLEVQRAVAASAGEIFTVLTDPRGHVAIDSSGMLMDASGDIAAKVGDTFVVHMDREALNDYPLGLYDVTIEIVTFEPVVACQSLGSSGPPQARVGGVHRGVRIGAVGPGPRRSLRAVTNGSPAWASSPRNPSWSPQAQSAATARNTNPAA
jgi:hypothetical protein